MHHPPCRAAALRAAALPPALDSPLEFSIDSEACEAPRRLLCSAPGHRRKASGRPAWASLTASQPPVVAGAIEDNGRAGKRLELLPVGVVEGTQKKPYVWDPQRGRLRAVDPLYLSQGGHYGRTLQGHLQRMLHDLNNAFFPDASNVTPDYWEFARWKAVHRVFSSMSSVFATQSLLRAVGVGAKRSLPAAAAINWVLKDGLGRLGRLTVATRFGESFDSDLKRFRFTTSAMYCAALSLEYLTPLFPQHFLVLASLANVGKSVGLTTFIATQPAFHRSFARGENLADISAKAQAQQMVMDNIGLAAAVALTHACSRSDVARWVLPFVAFPVLCTGDLYAIYRELRSIHLRTLNKERAEIIAEHWLRSGEVPTPLQVSDEERLILPARISRGCLPLTIGSLQDAVRSEEDLHALLGHSRDCRYLLTYSAPCQPPAAAGSLPSSSPGSASNDQQQRQLREQGGGGTNGRARGSAVASRRGELLISTSSSSNSSVPGSSSGGGGNGRKGWLREAWGLWLGSQQRGAAQVALRKDATHHDILQAILQVAYLRQAMHSPPPSTAGGGATVLALVGGGAGEVPAAPAGQLRSSADEDCCDSCRDMDRQLALQDSKRQAQASLQPFMHSLEQRGWQVAPFMLSSTEKRGYVMMGG